MMEINPVVCSHCSAGVSDPFSIRLHDIVGAYFICKFCGTMNIINSTQAKRDIIETIAKAPQISTMDEFDPVMESVRFDVSTIVRDQRPIVVTSFVDTVGKYDLLDSFAKPMIVIDVDSYYHPMTRNGKVYVVHVVKNISKLASSLVGVLNEHEKFKTIVIDEWRAVQNAVSKYIGDSIGGRTLTPSDWAMRNEITDWLLHVLRIISENGVEVQIFHDNHHEMWNIYRTADIPKHSPTDDIPHNLMYSAMKVNLMTNGVKTQLMSDDHIL